MGFMVGTKSFQVILLLFHSLCIYGCTSLALPGFMAGTPERGHEGKRPSCPFLRRTRGQECPYGEAICFFNNVQFDIMKTMNLTLKLNNQRILHWSFPDMETESIIYSS